MKKKDFAHRVYAVVEKIPQGKVSTYRDVAHALHCKAYRAVGQALNKNPYAPQVPCHRIIASDGSLGGFAHGLKKKKEMLTREGIKIKDNQIDLNKYSYAF